MDLHSKTKTSFYRRIYVAWLITQGFDTVPKIIAVTGMPRRTAQDTLAAIHELAIDIENTNGVHRIKNWGAVNPVWVEQNIPHLKEILQYP